MGRDRVGRNQLRVLYFTYLNAMDFLAPREEAELARPARWQFATHSATAATRDGRLPSAANLAKVGWAAALQCVQSSGVCLNL